MARLLLEAITDGEENHAMEIIHTGAYGCVDSQTSHQDGTALFLCCSRGYLQLAETLLAIGASVHAHTKDFATPLHAAADQGHVDIVNLLIRCHADVNSQTHRGDTPLHLAAFRGHSDVMRALVASGADSGLQNVNHVTAETEARTARHTDAADYLRNVGREQYPGAYTDDNRESTMLRLEPPSDLISEPGLHSYTSQPEVTYQKFPILQPDKHMPLLNTSPPSPPVLPGCIGYPSNQSQSKCFPSSCDVSNNSAGSELVSVMSDVSSGFGESLREDMDLQHPCGLVNNVGHALQRFPVNGHGKRSPVNYPVNGRPSPVNFPVNGRPSPTSFPVNGYPSPTNYPAYPVSPSYNSGQVYAPSKLPANLSNVPHTSAPHPSFNTKKTEHKLSNTDVSARKHPTPPLSQGQSFVEEFASLYNSSFFTHGSLPIDSYSGLPPNSGRQQYSVGSSLSDASSMSLDASSMSLDTSSTSSFSSTNSSRSDLFAEKPNNIGTKYTTYDLHPFPQGHHHLQNTFRRANSVQGSPRVDNITPHTRPTYVKSMSSEPEPGYSYLNNQFAVMEASNNLSFPSSNSPSAKTSRKGAPSMTCVNIPLN